MNKNLCVKNAKIAFTLFFYIVALFLASCQQKNQPNSPDEEAIQSNASVKWITPVDNIDLDNINLYSESNNLQFAADDNAKVSLYVNAEKGESGKFMFDDGQDWMLIVETSFGSYPLFPRKYVQLGKVDYAVFNEYDGSEYNIFHVLVTISDSGSYEIYDCIFDNEEKSFKVVPVYSAMNINPMGFSR